MPKPQRFDATCLSFYKSAPPPCFTPSTLRTSTTANTAAQLHGMFYPYHILSQLSSSQIPYILHPKSYIIAPISQTGVSCLDPLTFREPRLNPDILPYMHPYNLDHSTCHCTLSSPRPSHNSFFIGMIDCWIK